MFNPKEFGEYLKEKRNEKKMNLTDLANKSGVDQGYLSRLENGKAKSPSSDTLAKIADGLQMKRELVFYAAGALTSEQIDYEKMLKPIDVAQLLMDESQDASWGGKTLSQKDRETIKELIEVVIKREYGSN